VGGRGRILVVCAANRARSPIAHLLLQRALGTSAVRVDSAGTHASPAAPVTRSTRLILEARGIDADAFASRRLTAELIADADLVLCAERANRSDVVRLVARAHRKTFTLTQAERLLGVAPAPPVETVAELAVRLAAARGILPQDPDDDVPDPVGGDVAVYARAAERIDRAVWSIAHALGAAK